MSYIIFLNSLGVLLNILLFTLVCFLIYLVILDIILDYKISVLKGIIDKLEDIGEGDYKPTEGNPVEVKPLSAEEAVRLKQASVTQAEVNKLLKPVFDKVTNASEKGYSEIFLSGRDWYYNKNEKYKIAIQQLTDLGYSVWKDNDIFGVWVKW
ncbi:Hypothetical protein DAL_16 [Psychrobacter phage D'Alembert]|nr:Hypothetical protein DAL_16 [Psychrobacter phage D'Alembert]